MELLEPERIGVELSEEFQLHPEQSTDAIVVHHPEAKYFNAQVIPGPGMRMWTLAGLGAPPNPANVHIRGIGGVG